MPQQLVVGAGMIGRPLAERLAARGDQVTVGTRSGAMVPGAESMVLNASDPQTFTRAATGMSTIFLCINPRYTDWTTQWPPVIDAALVAASVTGARLVLMGNLYPYGAPTGPMTEHSPETTTETKGLVRKDVWHRARDAHDRGEIRAVEVRASDYFGPGVIGTAHLDDRFFRAILASKTARVVGQPGRVHSWSYLPDIVSTLVAAADHAGEWGRLWHVPSTAVTRDDIAAQLNRRYGTHGTVAGYPQWLLKSLGTLNPMMQEIWASSYQLRVPFLIDSAESERLLGVAATPWADALGTTADSYRASADSA
ncbi:NAD-dependent epimerase [Cryobacterium sinapicolor]|uniref:NAD-dependent epimerase n=1 Tax=Cryobacterium sinapicolor TaxID=1259236 RepID=A0ABY2JEX1_9MICO|nr:MULTISPECIES: NAD-dependent epimerase/dehydratase family protein [Cryobacterium]TFC94366.1 NAD-dependent epimerase [Cryobacterium sp. TMT3-29-2]TFD04316.1 NAD-dependent epimerase [Cryobacterium sinapicolor]